MIIKHISIFQADTCFPGVLRLPEAAGPAPAVVFHNGYCAYMQMYDAMAEAFCRAGYVTLQYDGRGTYGAQKGGFLCGTQWLEDAACAVGYLTGLPEVDGERIGAAGVSMGGAITIMQGAADPRVKCLYAMAPVTTGRTLIEGGWCRSRGREAWEEFYRALLSDAARAAQGFPSQIRRRWRRNAACIPTRPGSCPCSPCSTAIYMWTPGAPRSGSESRCAWCRARRTPRSCGRTQRPCTTQLPHRRRNGIFCRGRDMCCPRRRAARSRPWALPGLTAICARKTRRRNAHGHADAE